MRILYISYDGLLEPLGQSQVLAYQLELAKKYKIFILSFALLRPYYIANRTKEILISNIHLLSPQKWSQFVDFDIEKEFPREQP